MTIGTMSKNQLLMVLEKLDTPVNVSAASSKNYILEAIVAEFGVKNNNGRIYDADEYLPHLVYLQDQINKKNLLGHLDHPTDFEVRLSDASHIIESLVYDKAAGVIRARIRLLDTDSGRKAKALVDDGVQLSISSRAAGMVEKDSKVKIKRIFTYDLVAQPGFDNAQLHRVNESFGIPNSQDDIGYFDMTDKYPGLIEEFINEEFGSDLQNKNNKELNFVTTEKMQAYSVMVRKQFTQIQEELKTAKDIGPSGLDERLGKLEEKLDKLFNHIELVKNTSEDNFKIVEDKFDKVQENFEVIDTALDKSEENFKKVDDAIVKTNENFEFLDNAIGKTNENFEKIDKSIFVTENNFKSIDNALQVLENNNNTVDDALGKIDENFNKLDTALIHFDESFKSFDKGFEIIEENMELLDESISYSEKINDNTKAIAGAVTKLNSQIKKTFESKNIEFINSINEELGIDIPNNDSTNLNESHSINESTEDLMNLDIFSDENITATLEAAQNKKANENFSKWPFLSIVSEQTQNLFMELTEVQKQKISNTIVDQRIIDESRIIKLIDETTAPATEPKWLQLAPEKYKGMYESLPAEIQARLGGEASFRILEDAYQVKNFWETRTYLNESVSLQFSPVNLNESKKHNPNTLGYSKEYLDSIVKSLQNLK